METKVLPIADLELWDKNPRAITREGLERLKRQITYFGQYKPLVVKPEGDKFVVLGGNMRLVAMRELGLERIWVSVVHPKNPAEEVEYALSDNDRVGRYDRKKLARVILPHRAEIRIEDYKITLGEEVSFLELLERFGPAVVVEDKEMDETLSTKHECQECGYRW